ncbi:Kinesin light chain [Pleurostoma richardsiae]|uniref:Kinesin light chain n=1 Tax=Pleurostoma richardsiae TaxID=41990 RepID=A0AA38VG04_9PEZI|nr:Kinesin light chain [Pleurostoma richardsiae]
MAEREVDPRSFQMLTAGPSFGTIHGHNVIAGQQTFGGTAINNIYLPGRSETPPRPFASIPFRQDPGFVNRGDILQQLKQRCAEPAGRVALAGLGGVGKSQLAIEFAYRIAEEEKETWVFWVHAGTRARVEEGFRAIADVVKLPGREQPTADLPQLVYAWLSHEKNGRWVMILDSADDRAVFEAEVANNKPLRSYLPQSRNGSILLTTRDKDLARRLVGEERNIIQVGAMMQTDALLLLEKRLGTISDMDTAKELVRALDCVPLAISQAAGYIQASAPRSSLKKYLAEFREGERKRTRLLSHGSADLSRDGSASNSVLTTWQISFDYIHSQRQSAADLLAFMSFFDRQGIPETLLKSTKTSEDTGRKCSTRHTWEDSASPSSDCEPEGGFEDDIQMLRDFSLISTNEDGDTFEMHGLVQLSTRKWLEAKERHEEFVRKYVTQMAVSFPTGDYNNWAICQRLFSHVEAAVDYKPVGHEREAVWATLLYNGAWYALAQGRYDVAERMACKAWRSRREILGKEDNVTLSSELLFAEVLLNQGRWDKAEELFVQVMETRKTKLEPGHPDTLTTMANLASTFWNQGRWKEAESLEVQVIETGKTVLGEEHPSMLTSIANLASTYKNQGRWKEAESLEVQVMETGKRVLGEEHPSTLTSIANLASTYRNQGRWKEAEDLQVKELKICSKVLGEEHPSTLTSMANLAATFWNQGRWEEAESLEVQVIDTRKRKSRLVEGGGIARGTGDRDEEEGTRRRTSLDVN